MATRFSPARPLAALGVVLAAVALGGCASTTTPTVPAASTTVDKWAPAGYTEWNDEVAFVWSTKGTVKCASYLDSCWGVTVVSHYGCPGGVYVELSVLDHSGSSIDKANDITAALGAGDTAKSAPGIIGDNGSGKAKVARLNCL